MLFFLLSAYEANSQCCKTGSTCKAYTGFSYHTGLPGATIFPLFTGCLECTDSGDYGECTKCSSGSPVGMYSYQSLYYFCDGPHCTSTYCQICSPPSACTKCVDGYFLNGDSGCDPCPRKCATCDSATKCTSCKAT